MDSQDFFPYFAIVGGLSTVIICAYAPQGKAQDTALTVGSGLASGGLAAYGLQLKYGDRK